MLSDLGPNTFYDFRLSSDASSGYSSRGIGGIEVIRGLSLGCDPSSTRTGP